MSALCGTGNARFRRRCHSMALFLRPPGTGESSYNVFAGDYKTKLALNVREA